MPLPDRHRAHRRIAAQLVGSTDDELLQSLSDTQILGPGHALLSLPPDHTKVFVKLLPLTALEMQHATERSTANLFGLPTCYLYRFGGCGFGAWRELDVHGLANGWVLSGQCARFPLLHHWRVLPIVHTDHGDRMSLEIWGDCPAIHERVAAVAQATCSAVLFLEYFPLTLNQWLRGELLQHPDPLEVVEGIEEVLVELLGFTRAQGVVHMDAHLDNILTDGDGFYLSDYGLAVSRGFQLGADEQQLFESHQNYDLCTALTCLVYAIIINYDSGDDWRKTLRELRDGAHDALEAMPAAIRPYLARRAPLAQEMGRFFGRSREDLTTPYPATSLQRILDRGA